MYGKRRSESGFSLVEVILTLVVVGVSVAAIARFQGVTLKEGQVAKQRAEAASLLEKKIEELRGNPAGNTGTHSDNVNSGGMVYNRSWTVTKNPAIAGEYDISVTADWADLSYRSVQTSSAADAMDMGSTDISVTDTSSAPGNSGSHSNAGGNGNGNGNAVGVTEIKSSQGTSGGVVTPNTTLTLHATVRMFTPQKVAVVVAPCTPSTAKKSRWRQMGERDDDYEHGGMTGGDSGAMGGCSSTSKSERHGMMGMEH